MLKSGFFNSLNNDRLYDATDFGKMFDGIINDGIFSAVSGTFVVHATTGLTLSVDPGRAYFNKHWVYNDAPILIDLKEPAPVLQRIDAVVIEVNENDRNVTIKTVEGTPVESSPVRPTMIHTEMVNQYALCYISVAAGATEITQSDITSVIGTDETPFASGIMQQVSIETLLTQWDASWQAQQTTKMAQYDAEFEAWFNGVREHLTTDVAGNLQNQINDINNYLNSIGDAETEEW